MFVEEEESSRTVSFFFQKEAIVKILVEKDSPFD
jgi:hypothetical protein